MTEVMYRHEVPFGHRLMNHPGKCKWPHGHNYIFEVSIKGPVDQNGMVLDFSVLKQAVRQFFDPFDHAFVLHEDDPLVFLFREVQRPGGIAFQTTSGKLESYVLPTKVVILNTHPTAENLAALVNSAVLRELGMPYQIAQTTCWEQRDCSAISDQTDDRVQIVERW